MSLFAYKELQWLGRIAQGHYACAADKTLRTVTESNLGSSVVSSVGSRRGVNLGTPAAGSFVSRDGDGCSSMMVFFFSVL